MKFNLERALAGEPVLLRSGEIAQVMCDLDANTINAPKYKYPLIGVSPSQRQKLTWSAEGAYSHTTTNRWDIVGMAPSATFDHWDAIDEHWNYIAADSDGYVYFYSESPVKGPFGWNLGGDYVDVTNTINFKYTNWETSLVKRPSHLKET